MITKRFFSLLILLFFVCSTFILPSGHSSVISASNASLKPSVVSPPVFYNNSSNLITRWNASLNKERDSASINITSVWSSGIYVDDNGNLLWTDTYGFVFVYYYSVGVLSNYGSPYSTFSYAGPVTSIAAVNYSTVDYVVILTERGYVFEHPIGPGEWINATAAWNLPLPSEAKIWTSVTSNVEGYSYEYDEVFVFTSLNGSAYLYDTTNPSSSVWVYEAPLGSNSYGIISTVMSYQGYLYAVAYNGTVYVWNNPWQVYDETNLVGTVGITIDQANDSLYIINIKNNTDLYESAGGVGGTTGSFTPSGSIVFSDGTATSVTFDDYDFIFWAIETNGTIAGSDSTSSWSYSDNLLNYYTLPNVISIQSASGSNFELIAQYLKSSNIDNMLIFNLSLTDSASYLQFSYYLGVSKIVETVASLPSLSSLNSSVAIMPNSSYDASFWFYLLSSSSNEEVVLSYKLDFNIINHFSYIDLGA